MIASINIFLPGISSGVAPIVGHVVCVNSAAYLRIY